MTTATAAAYNHPAYAAMAPKNRELTQQLTAKEAGLTEARAQVEQARAQQAAAEGSHREERSAHHATKEALALAQAQLAATGSAGALGLVAALERMCART